MWLEHLFDGTGLSSFNRISLSNRLVILYRSVPVPGVPAGVVVRLLQCGAMVT